MCSRGNLRDSGMLRARRRRRGSLFPRRCLRYPTFYLRRRAYREEETQEEQEEEEEEGTVSPGGRWRCCSAQHRVVSSGRGVESCASSLAAM